LTRMDNWMTKRIRILKIQIHNSEKRLERNILILRKKKDNSRMLKILGRKKILGTPILSKDCDRQSGERLLKSTLGT